MKLMKKLLLSAIVTCSFTGQGYSMDARPAAAAVGPDFFAILQEDQNVKQIIQIILTRAANGDPTLNQFVNTFNNLRATCRRFRAILRMPGIGENILVRALGNSTILPNEALFEIAACDQFTWLIPLLVRAGGDINARLFLHNASRYGNLLAVKALIAAGANVNAQESGYLEHTPLYYAVLKNELPVVKELIKAGAIVNNTIWRPFKETYILFACDHNHPDYIEMITLLRTTAIRQRTMRVVQRTGQLTNQFLGTLKSLFYGDCG